jgi:hypothetical protein
MGADSAAIYAWARAAVRDMLIRIFQRIARGDPLPGLMPGEEDLP